MFGCRFNIVIQKGYRKTGDVVGTVRLQLQAPADEYYRSDRPYCGDGGTFPAAGGRPAGRHPCVFWDQYDAVFPPVEATATFLTTRFSRSVYTRPANCTVLSDPACRYGPAENKTAFFVSDPTFFTLFIDHTMNAPSLDVSRSAVDMDGVLASGAGRSGRSVDPCAAYEGWGFTCPPFISVGDPGKTDILPLAALLQAAGTNLSDFVSSDSSSSLYNETKRYAGVVLLVSIEYDNFFSYDPDAVRYTYAVSEVANTEFKAQQVIPEPGEDTQRRVLLDRHGVRVLVQQTGTIGKFDFSTLLVQLVSSLGLLAVATALVNFIAFSVLPMKNIYKQYKEVTSVDFSDIEHLPPSSLARFRSEDLINPQPAIFAGVGSAGDGGEVMAAGSNPAATQVKSAPKKQAATAGGFFAQLGKETDLDSVSSAPDSGDESPA